MKLLTLALMLTISGCSLIKVPAQNEKSITEENKIDFCINNYSENAIDNNTNCKNPIGELYAIKSSFYAQASPVYLGTRTFANVGGDLFFSKEWPSGVIFLFLTPFTFVGETIYYPVQVVEHFSVPDENIETALLYLKKAREYGYTDEYMSFIPSFVRVKNLDK